MDSKTKVEIVGDLRLIDDVFFRSIRQRYSGMSGNFENNSRGSGPYRK